MPSDPGVSPSPLYPECLIGVPWSFVVRGNKEVEKGDANTPSGSL